MNKDCRSNTFLSQNAVYVPQVKVCGLTHKRDAVQCAALGVNAVGFVFYSKSPRYIAPDLAGEISRELPDTVSAVGVFVDEPFEVIMRTIEKAKLCLAIVRERKAVDPVLLEVGVDLPGAVGHAGDGEVDAGGLDLAPVDRRLPLGDVDARDRLRLGADLRRGEGGALSLCDVQTEAHAPRRVILVDDLAAATNTVTDK